MAAITLNGKGSRSRVKNRIKFRENFDEINWPSKQKRAPEPKQAKPRDP